MCKNLLGGITSRGKWRGGEKHRTVRRQAAPPGPGFQERSNTTRAPCRPRSLQRVKPMGTNLASRAQLLGHLSEKAESVPPPYSITHSPLPFPQAHKDWGPGPPCSRAAVCIWGFLAHPLLCLIQLSPRPLTQGVPEHGPPSLCGVVYPKLCLAGQVGSWGGAGHRPRGLRKPHLGTNP